MSVIDKLLQTRRPFLTDGGFETSLFFIDGFDAPEFAAIVLMDDPEARAAIDRYFERFLTLAQEADTGFVLDTNTWRACGSWAEKLGHSPEGLLRLTRDAVAFSAGLRDTWSDRVSPILLNGVVGPAGDGYAPERALSPDEAQALHTPQVAEMAKSGVDMVSAITITHVGEAVGITRAVAEADLPAVISFTVETDGTLPDGTQLGAAIEATDAATGAAPIYYMVNCAHPEHFADALARGEAWIDRIGGVRANASRLSHAELDVAEELDDGDPEEFGRLHADVARLLPNLRVVGGCCGTDHRHVGCVSEHLHARVAA